MKRRDFFKLLGAVSGVALASCDIKKAPKKLYPYLVPPEEGIIPGEPVWYTSTCTECPVKCGILVKNRENRPVKLEGLKGHPYNDGTLCIRGQASIERMYHPKRIRTPLLRRKKGDFKPISWQEALQIVKNETDKNKGKTNIFFSSRTTGTLDRLINEFCDSQKFIRAPQFEVINYANIRKANRIVFGINDLPEYRIESSDFLLTIGADILDTFLNPIEFSQQIEKAKKRKFNWIHVEPSLTLTGAKASQRYLCNPGSEHFLMAYLVRNVKAEKDINKEIIQNVPKYNLDRVVNETGLSAQRIKGLIRALENADRPMVIAGSVSTAHKNGFQTALYAAILQYMLHMINRDIDFTRTWNYSKVGTYDEINTFFSSQAGKAAGIFIAAKIHTLDYTPAVQQFIESSSYKIAITDFYRTYMDDFDLILPHSHSLESWGDEESRTGVISIIQPTMEPIHNTKSEGDILLSWMGANKTYQEYLYQKWGKNAVELIKNGFLVKKVKRKWVGVWAPRVIKELQSLEQVPFDSNKTSLVLLPSIRTLDGRSKELTLLSEIPDPLTTISYGKWIAVSKKIARGYELQNGDVVQLKTEIGTIEIPVKVQPGLHENVLQLHIDQLNNIQVPEKLAEYPASLNIFQLHKTGKTEKIPVLSGSLYSDDREILPEEAHEHGKKEHQLYTLYEEHDHPDYRWAMAIDLDACTGCSACVAACYVENNVAITGKEEHLKGREMAWLRIEPYYDNELKPRFIPVMCQQCDNAPCESVCPVFATYHNPEGLNAQVYNRCVGTRYCSNNCPYKARRFNWFEWERTEPFSLMLNPDVSDRPKGVMEKCTFCVQRIRYAKDKAKDKGRKVLDGEVTPACAQTCPTQAITFGNIKDNSSRVSRKAHSEEAYRLLEDLGTRPAVYYLNDVKKGNKHES